MNLDLVGGPDPVADIHAAAVAADTARRVAGVARLQPGTWGLLQQLSRDLWTRVTGEPHPDTAGVQAEVHGDAVTIDITLVATGTRPATSVASDVQRAVTAAVPAQLGLAVDSVAVHVSEINLPE